MEMLARAAAIHGADVSSANVSSAGLLSSLSETGNHTLHGTSQLLHRLWPDADGSTFLDKYIGHLVELWQQPVRVNLQGGQVLPATKQGMT